MDFTKLPKKSKNFEDRTSDEHMNQLDWNWMMGLEALKNQGIPAGEALRGLDPKDVTNVLFQRALEEFGVSTMTDFSKVPNADPYFIRKKASSVGPYADFLLKHRNGRK